MEEEQLLNTILTLSKEIVALTSQVTTLRVSVNVLKVLLATQLSRDDVAGFLAILELQEKKVLEADPGEQERRQVAETIDALRAWKLRGGPPPDS
jgi:hypothetical protein